MTPPAKTFMGSKINCFQGSIALCRRGAIARGFSNVYAINIDSDFLRQKELELTAHNILLVY